MNRFVNKKIILLILLFLHGFTNTSFAKEVSKRLKQFSGIIHVHSTFSTGKDSIEEIVSKVKKSGIDIIVLTDHDLVKMEYGLPPFRNILKIGREKNSVIKTGPKKYLNEIKRLNEKYKDITIIAGVESAPFYYWTGNPIEGNLTSNNWRKHIHIIGLDNPDDYKKLPILHNSLSAKYTKKLILTCLPFLLSGISSIYLTRQKGIFKFSGFLILIFSVFAIINYNPFRSSMFNQYSKDQKEAPYQELIDYANSKGALSFWAHPESNLKKENHSGITMQTPKYSDDLLNTVNFTGFESVYQDTITFTNPGMGWDKILTEYCLDKRKKPVWGIGGLDYHGKDNTLNNVLTVFLLKENNRISILDALKTGKMYSLRSDGKLKLQLNQFSITNKTDNTKAVSGDILNSDGKVKINMNVSYLNKKQKKVSVTLIKRGEIIKTFSGKTPLIINFEDTISNDKSKTYYRLLVKGESSNYIISNPVFIKLKDFK